MIVINRFEHKASQANDSLLELSFALFNLQQHGVYIHVEVVGPLELFLVVLSDVFGVLQLLFSLLHQVLLHSGNVRALSLHLLQVAADLLLPGGLRFVIGISLGVTQLDGSDLQVHQNVFERGSVPRLRTPALFDEQPEANRTRVRNRQLQRVGANAPDDG
jgi:hypothetical protein